MIVRVWCESGAGWAPTHVPVTPHTSCRDVLDCCREPGDEPCLLFSVHPTHGVHVLRDTELPLEVASALGPEVQFVLKYIDGEYTLISLTN
uniref:Apoptosis-stimulating of p53 protein 2-like RA domain-containing protein n=1 Tax=Heliothis virescens TaxID=7102 RepID=A0A2A4JWB1_HELVI